jgi:uncharacterized protein
MLSVAESRPSERARFIQNTYTHLAGAVGAFTILEVLLFTSGAAGAIAKVLFASRFAWLGVIAAFALLGWMARTWAAKTDVKTQYIGLGVYVVAEALIFAPLIWLAATFFDPMIIPTAGIFTGLLFAGLTTIVFTTKKDFTFLGGALTMAGFVALGLIVCSALFGFQLGIWFSAAMILVAAGSILYDTSKVMHHHSVDQHVAASLELFASVALLFWYVLQFLMQLSSRD